MNRYHLPTMRTGYALAALALIACNSILGIDEPEHRKADAGATGGTSGGGTGGSTTGGTGGSGGTSSGGTAGMGGSGAISGSGGVAGSDGGSDAPLCTQSSATINGDTTIFSGQCGSNTYGSAPYGNIGSGDGRGLLRFDLSAAQFAALQNGTAQSMQLTLTRSIDCDEDGGNTCTGTQVTGSFQAYPLTNTWTENTGAGGYAGADWCRSSDGNPGTMWGTPGAEGPKDRGGPVGIAMQVDAAAPTAVFDLPAAPWQSWVTNNQLSILIQRQSASGMFVYATRESTKHAHPALTITICQ